MTAPLAPSLFSAVVETPFGGIGIRTGKGVVLEMVYLPPSFSAQKPADALAKRAVKQVERYLKNPDFVFDLPLAEVGTPFQARVWRTISAVPRGEVVTYGQIAKLIRSGPRAVGQACGANWFSLVIPCHRVTASGGLGGFSSDGDLNGFHIGVKRWLLAHEGVKFA